MKPKGRAYSTAEAVIYLGERGVRTSVRTLARQRSRCEDDPADSGPPFYRRPDGGVDYFKSDLDVYVAERLARLEFRGRADTPERLRRSIA